MKAAVCRRYGSPGAVTVELLDGAAPSDLARAVLASGASLDALVPQRRTLEDAFLEATEG